MTRTGSFGWCLLSVPAAFATANCQEQAPAEALVKEARLGVFYGGQIQQREEVPRAFDAAQQVQGFRLAFSRPVSSDTQVRWQIEMPGGKRAMYVSRLGQSMVRAGQASLDQVFKFEAGDPTGLYNIRVFVGDELVIDRPWLVYDPIARRRAVGR